MVLHLNFESLYKHCLHHNADKVLYFFIVITSTLLYFQTGLVPLLSITPLSFAAYCIE